MLFRSIELTPESNEGINAPAVRKAGRTVSYRVPQVQNARLMDGTEILSSERIPIYQFGALVDVPVVFAP